MSEQIPQTPPQPLTPAEEKQWAMIAHLSVWVSALTAFFGIPIAFGIYLIYKDRSRYVAYHSLQAALMQAIFWLGGAVLSVLTAAGMSIPVVGLICIPLACVFALMPLGALIYGTIGGIQTNQGQDFKYWLIGDWVRSTLTG